MPAVDLDVMRADYKTVRRWMREVDGYTEADLLEIDMAVKDAVDRKADLLTGWAKWLAMRAEQIRRDQSASSGIEARIKAQAAERKAA